MANGNLWEKNISDTVLDVEHKNVLIINTLKWILLFESGHSSLIVIWP